MYTTIYNVYSVYYRKHRTSQAATVFGHGVKNKAVSADKASLGHTIFTYDLERTVCDIVRSRNKIEGQIE
jgi:hypothetical protein